MKTPNRITLICGGRKKYNPETDEYETQARKTVTVPCLVNKVSQSKVFELYGNRTDVIISCRFQKEQAPFTQAVYKRDTYEPIEAIDVPIKGAVRLKKVGPFGR
jgi:hypothetical protein|nr:MAG TPA: head closure knob [Caudoviricetes sp.]